MSTFFKQLYRYTHPRTYRHNENLWPFCRIMRNKNGEITKLRYKGKIVPLVPISTWHKKFNGDALITATGPSINQINFSRLPTMSIVGVNGAYALRNYLSFNLYIIVDTTFIEKRSDILAMIITDSALTLFTTLHGITCLIDRFTLTAIHCQITLIEDACYRIYQPKIPSKQINQYFGQNHHIQFSKDLPNIAFTTDIRSGIFDAGTVVFWTLQILLFLGFKRLYIAGLDMKNFHRPRFYETEENRLCSFLNEKFETLLVPAFTLASRVLYQYGVEIKNLSLNSALSHSIIEKVSYHDAFQN